MEVIRKVKRNWIELLKQFSSTELPPFPDVQRERTHYGSCLRQAFTIGEYQDKIYRFAIEDAWFDAGEAARKLMHTEEEIQRTCGVNTIRARHYLSIIILAIQMKDKRKVDELISEHDTEILAALETAKYVVS